ncbi:MAG TPA: Rieske (2Fe-2S) protein [Longimicrobiales bacterium]
MDCTDCTNRRSFITRLALAATALVLPIDAIAAAAHSNHGHHYPVPGADGAFIDRDSQVILVRWQNTIYAFALSCPHQRTALRWRDEDHRFQCPKHKSKYQPDGTFIEGRATRGMDRFHVALEGNEVVVDTSVLYKQDVDLAGWQHAFVTVSQK